MPVNETTENSNPSLNEESYGSETVAVAQSGTEITPQRDAVSKPAQTPANTIKRWNTFIYLAGDNNLIEESIWALTEMQTVSAGLNKTNLKVQFDHGLTESFYDFTDVPKPAQAIVGHPSKLKLSKGEPRHNGRDTSESVWQFILSAANNAAKNEKEEASS